MKAQNREPKREPKTPRPEPPVTSAPPGRPSVAGLIGRWFLSKTVRQATAMRRHVQKLVNHQRDILGLPPLTALQTALRELQEALATKTPAPVLEKQMENLENVANKWLKPYPHAAWRENVEVLLVALTVAMGIRTFFLQPFKIPTGSMQPTLYGVTSVPDYSQVFDPSAVQGVDTNFVIPKGWARIRDWFAGVSYLEVRAAADGEVHRVEQPFKLFIFNIFQQLQIGDHVQTIWFPPDYGGSTLERRAGLFLQPHRVYHQGEEVLRMKIVNGDHLFVDRLTYNFRPPTRGEIIVFETRGIRGLPQDQFYIKRLVALGTENVQVGDDRHLVVNGNRLTASTPHFEKVYSFNPKIPPRENQYSGHVNEKVLRDYYPNFPGMLAPLFPDGAAVYTVPPDHYMVMGDNTMNSLDSRSWGDFPATNVIGKSLFVYWPITDRFGIGYHR